MHGKAEHCLSWKPLKNLQKACDGPHPERNITGNIDTTRLNRSILKDGIFIVWQTN